MVLPVYPKGVVPWTPRKDLVNIVYALDPNTLAAEIGAVETTLGIMPHVETAPPVGSAITYATVSARIHDVQMGTLAPVCTVSNNGFNVSNGSATGVYNSYNRLYDPFGWYNGNDITVKADGWYTITANQTVNWWSSGYWHLSMFLDGTEVTADHWSWDFPENSPSGRWNGRDHVMSMTWQGIVHSGQRVQVKTENGTGRAQLPVTGAYLRAKYDRQVSHTQLG